MNAIATSALIYGGLDGPDTIYSPPVTKTWETGTVSVNVDIKPGACPTPFNVNSKGVLPVAILGTSTFDVTQISPATVKLRGISPVKWVYRDVATPFGGATEVCTDCTTAGPDGWLDLLLYFDNTAITGALGPVSNGNCLILGLTGNLKAEYGSADIEGGDVLLIVKKK